MFKSFTASDKKKPAKPGRTGPADLAAPPAPVQRAVRLMQAGAVVSTLSLIFTVIGSFSLKHNMMFPRARPAGRIGACASAREPGRDAGAP